jgi:hypothetical protein
MQATESAVSYVGAPPGRVPHANTFDWIFSNPFENESAFVLPGRSIPKTEDSRQIFVDEKSGKLRSQHTFGLA